MIIRKLVDIFNFVQNLSLDILEFFFIFDDVFEIVMWKKDYKAFLCKIFKRNEEEQNREGKDGWGEDSGGHLLERNDKSSGSYEPHFNACVRIEWYHLRNLRKWKRFHDIQAAKIW